MSPAVVRALESADEVLEVAAGGCALGGAGAEQQGPVVEEGGEVAAELGHGDEEPPRRVPGAGRVAGEGGEPHRGDDVFDGGLLLHVPPAGSGLAQLAEEHLGRGGQHTLGEELERRGGAGRAGPPPSPRCSWRGAASDRWLGRAPAGAGPARAATSASVMSGRPTTIEPAEPERFEGDVGALHREGDQLIELGGISGVLGAHDRHDGRSAAGAPSPRGAACTTAAPTRTRPRP